MARASKPGVTNPKADGVGDTFAAADCNAFDTAIDAVIDDYVSQTDTTEQNVASNLNIGANLLKTTNCALKEASATRIAARNATDTGYVELFGSNLHADGGGYIYTDNIGERTGSAGITLNHDIHITTKAHSRTMSAETLGVGAATFAVTGEVKILTGDGGANAVTTITGGRTGQILYLIFTDGNITMTNDDGHGANTLDLAGNLISADDTTLTLIFDGTSWYELARSVN